jgi:hypothetical protein
MNRLSRTTLGLSVGTGLFLAGCTNNGGNETAPTTTHDRTIGTRGDKNIGVDEDGLEGVEQSKDWKLISIEGIGKSDVDKDAEFENEAAFYKITFDIGGVAISCLAPTDADRDFPDMGLIDPQLCFIDGDPAKPLVGSNGLGK